MSTNKKIVLLSILTGALMIALIVSACMPVSIKISMPEIRVSQQTTTQEINAAPVSTSESAATQSAQPTQPPAAEPAAAIPTQAPAPAATEPTAAEPAATEPAATQPVQPQTPADDGKKQEIVELYNTAVNKVKKEASSLTRNYKHLSVPEDQLELPGAIQGLGKTAIGTFVKGSDTPETWTSKEDMQIVFPVGNTDYSSHLTADMVETAVCEDTGSAYKVTLKLYNDQLTSPEKGQGYAGVFNTITASTLTGINIPTVTFNKVNVNGINGRIACTIDKTTKRVTEITFANTDILDLEVKVVVATLGAKLALVAEENYTVKY